MSCSFAVPHIELASLKVRQECRCMIAANAHTELPGRVLPNIQSRHLAVNVKMIADTLFGGWLPG
jgi:hypothetical protein